MFESLPDFPRHRRWRDQIFPGPIVVAIIQRPATRKPLAEAEPQYLLIRRNSSPYNGQWALVGGKWDFGETLATAVTREVKEETNLDTNFTALRGIVNERLAPPPHGNESATPPSRDAAHFLLFVCELAAARGVASEQNEGAVAWFSLAELDELHAQNAIIPSDYLMLRQFAGSTESVPHFEAEMLSTPNGDQVQSSRLIRFERINGPDSQ